MKQRLMALTIDFEKAFNTVALITVNGSISQHSETATLRICERYIGLIQLLDRKDWLSTVDMERLKSDIGAMEMYMQFYPNQSYYCPWAENTSASIDAIPDYSSGPHGLHCDCPECATSSIDHGDDCDCNDCYMRNEPNFKGENYGTLYSTGK